MEFLDGTRGAHVSISGISGVATKTSFALFLLHSIFRSGALGARAVNAKALVFSVKGEDLLFLDQPNVRLDDDLRSAYADLGLPAEPFASTGFWAPPIPDDQTGRPNVTGRTSGVEAFWWTIAEFCSRQLLPYVFADAEDERHQYTIVIHQVATRLRLDAIPYGENGAVRLDDDVVTTYEELVDVIVSRLTDDATRPEWAGPVTGVGAINAFIRRLRSSLRPLRPIIRADLTGTPRRQISTQDQQVTVVDLHNLHERAQRFVVGVVLAAETARKEDAGPGGLLFTMINELNKYAPREGTSPIKEVLLELLTPRPLRAALSLLGPLDRERSWDKTVGPSSRGWEDCVVRVVLAGASSGEISSGGEGDPAGSPEFHALPSVGPAVRQLADAFGRFDWVKVAAVLFDPTKDELEDCWRSFLSGPSADPVIFHFAGHGWPLGSSLYLPVRDSLPGSIASTAIDLNHWLEEAEHTEDAPSVLFLLDVCAAGLAANYQLFQGVREQERKAWVIAACASDERTYGARFTRAAAQAMELLRRGLWDISPAMPSVPLDTVAYQISQEMLRQDDGYGYMPNVTHSPMMAASVRTPPFFANPAYRPAASGRLMSRLNAALADIAAEFDAAFDLGHFLGKAAGIPPSDTGLSGCFFTGRTEELSSMRDWLESDGPVLIVTGQPGAGKSALIGVTVWLSHPGLLEVSTPVLSRVPSELRPRRRYPNLVAIHARQRTARQIVDSMCAQLGIAEEHDGGSDASDPLDRFLERAVGMAEPVIVVVDAIDEAHDSEALVNQVIARLVDRRRQNGRPAARVLAGIRPWWDQFGDLLLWADGAVIDLDRAEAVVTGGQAPGTGEISRYLSDVLALSAGYSRADDREQVARAVEAELASGRYEGGYLLVTLYAAYLSTSAPLDAAAAAAHIPADLSAMLDLQLTMLEADKPWVRVVLTALAAGFGDGMPLDLIHIATTAYLPADSVAEPTLEEVRAALESMAFYLRARESADGLRVYHFFHQSLTDNFRDDSPSSHLLSLLMSTVPEVEAPVGVVYAWDRAPLYMRSHAMDHAAATGTLGHVDRLLLDPSFVLAAEGKLNDLPQGMSRSARRVASALGKHWRLSPLDPPDVVNQSLQLELVRRGGAEFARCLETLLGDLVPVLSFRWATDHDPTAMTGCLDELDTQPTAVALAESSDTAIIVIGGADGSLQALDSPYDGGEFRYLLEDVHEGSVEHLIVVEVAGKPKAISYGTDRQAAVVDVETGMLEHRAAIPGKAVTAMAAAGELAPSMFVAGHADGKVSVIKLTQNGFRRIEVRGSGHRRPVSSLAVLEAPDESSQLLVLHAAPEDGDEDGGPRKSLGILDGEPVTIEDDGNGSVLIIDSDHDILYRLEAYDGNLRLAPGGGYRGFVRILETLGPQARGLVKADIHRIGQARLALTAHEDGYVRTWDLDLASSPGLPGTAAGLFTARHQERDVAIAFSARPAAVKVWDMGTGMERAFLGLARFTHVAVAASGDRLLALVSTIQDGLHLYDIIAGYDLSSLNPPVEVAALALTAQPDGALAAVGGADGEINIWRITADEHWHHLGSLAGHGLKITDLSFTSGSSFLMLLAAFADSLVLIWAMEDLTAPFRTLFADDQNRRILACGGDENAVNIVTRDETGRIEVWDAVKNKRTARIDDDPGESLVAALTSTGACPRLVTGDTKNAVIRTWDTSTGKETGHPVHLPADLQFITGHASGVIASCGRDVVASAWKDQEAKEPATAVAVRCSHVLAWFPGELLASDPAADSWDLQTIDDWTAGEP